VSELLEGRIPPEFTWEFQKQAPYTSQMRQLYVDHAIEWQDYDELARMCRSLGVSGLSRANHLTEAENRELFAVRDIPRLVGLVVLGLTRALGEKEDRR